MTDTRKVSSLDECLLIESSEKNLSGLSAMFADSDSSDEETSKDDISFSTMSKISLQIEPNNDNLTFTLVQSETAFGQGLSNDQTGTVIGHIL